MHYFRFLLRRVPALVLVVATAGNVMRAETILPANVVPRETGVLLLPPLDTEPWSENVLPQRQFVVRRRLQYEFISRQFKVHGEALAMLAAKKNPAIDLGSVATRTAENLDELAARSGTRWVVNVVVEEVMEDSTGAAESLHGHCRVLMQIRDAARHRWLVNGPYTGRNAAASSSPVWLFMELIDNATRDALVPVLQSHPVIVPVAPVGQIADYLTGQVEPLVADPKVTFAGLGAK